MGNNQAVLIDTSSWIEALRSTGNVDVRNNVRQLMLDGSAAWCDMISVELWNGARGDYEKHTLLELEKEIICLPTTRDVWILARKLAKICRQAGKTVPSADLVVTACALFHHAEIESCDAHISLILSIHG